jgi:hypothetical protein
MGVTAAGTIQGQDPVEGDGILRRGMGCIIKAHGKSCGRSIYYKSHSAGHVQQQAGGRQPKTSTTSYHTGETCSYSPIRGTCSRCATVATAKRQRRRRQMVPPSPKMFFDCRAATVPPLACAKSSLLKFFDLFYGSGYKNYLNSGCAGVALRGGLLCRM